MNENLFLAENLVAAWTASRSLPTPSSTRLMLGACEHGAATAYLVPASLLFERWHATMTSNPQRLQTVAPCGKGIVEWVHRLGTEPIKGFGISNFGLYNEEGTQIAPQGGRHRAAALLLLGVDPIPAWFDSDMSHECEPVDASRIEVTIRTDVDAVVRAFEAARPKPSANKRPWWHLL